MAKDKVIIRPEHREVLKKMVENVGLSREEAMGQLEYSESYAKNGNITKTDSWQELLRTYIPDELLAKRHKELLDKREIKRTFNHELGEFIDEVTNQPDTNAVKAGLDMAYKLKRRYPKEGINIEKGIIIAQVLDDIEPKK